MLILKRKPGTDTDESKVIFTLPDGRVIAIHLLDLHDGYMRVGVAAPRDIAIHRVGSPATAGEPSDS